MTIAGAAHPTEANVTTNHVVDGSAVEEDAEENVVEKRDQTNEPLAHRLRNAAIERTTTDAERVDDFVLDKDGVLDLREFERDTLGASVADPAKALATIRGQLGDAHEVSDLYDESEPEPSRWPFGRRSRHTLVAEVAPTVRQAQVAPPEPAPATRRPLSRLSMVPLTSEAPTTSDVPDDATVPDTGVFESASIRNPTGPEIDLRDEGRPTATCPKCMGLAHRDLFDRFSQTEFYSCDNCMHMWQQEAAG
ncbi:MAG: hypothetical protein R2707_18110 [Acidimicrobiales bacterium]